MPRGDGTGPGSGGSGKGQGAGMGAGGYCICVNCGEKTVHQMGVPCVKVQCPKCGGAMTRDNSGNP